MVSALTEFIVGVFERFALFWRQMVLGEFECVSPATSQVLVRYARDCHVKVPTFEYSACGDRTGWARPSAVDSSYGAVCYLISGSYARYICMNSGT